MAAIGLNADDLVIEQCLEAYNQRLFPFADSPGRYQELFNTYRKEIASTGIADTLTQHLPLLISGWARAAYHPLIRMAYGFENQIASEVAAGLAYQSYCGADPTIEHLAQSARSTGFTSQELFRLARKFAVVQSAGASFGERLSIAINHDEFPDAAKLVTDNLRSMSRTALDIFASTHDFFALHFVTGAHAYRLLYPFAGEYRDAIFNLGLLAGYSAVGAPEFTRYSESQNVEVQWLPLIGQDEHNIKLAYSALSQATHWQEPAYVAAAVHYLRSR